MTCRVAAIDCGTNSIRLLIADVDDVGDVDDGADVPGAADRVDLPGGRLTDVVREMRVVRLGQGVDSTGHLAPEAIERARLALRDYAATIAERGATRVRMVATSATRDADNRAEFIAMVAAELGIAPEVISGHEDAQLSYSGAASVLPAGSGPLLVADIGGGSTELVRGGDGPLRAHSMRVGCVRLTERHLHDDPPTADQVVELVTDVRSAIGAARVDVPLDAGARFIGVAGTVTTLAAIVLELAEYDSTAIHGAVISAGQVQEVTERLLAMSRAERAAIPVMHPGRVDVIVGGALVLRTLIEEIGTSEVVASEHDILDGIALALAE